jgi:hypothetical protein
VIRKRVIDLILEISGEENAFDILEDTFAGVKREVLSESLLECGIIPECFEHDSSEEKLWAKYCDILLAHVWTHLGVPSEVLRARGDSADVFGRSHSYTIVGDAKAFRLSRTAKNQKDFKVRALNDWRRQDTYASLVSPLYQYPRRSSQIYRQAIEHNVTLLSYVHSKFLLDRFPGQDLQALWRVPSSLPLSKSASAYWQAIDDTVCRLVDADADSLRAYKVRAIEKTQELGDEGIQFWKTKIEAYKKLSQEEAVRRLIKAEKIEAKIRTISRAINIPFP